MLAVVAVGGGVWLAVGGGDKESDDAKSPAAVGTPSATVPGGSTGGVPGATTPSAKPSASPSADSDNPYAPLPDGSGVQGGWLSMQGGIVLGFSGAHPDQPDRDNALYSDGASDISCTGRWQETEAAGSWKVTLQRKHAGVRDESKDRVGTVERLDEMLTVHWTKPTMQPEVYKRLPQR
ncbi:hypothetical protein [Streptomyces sp. NPDC059452]|uniref:hypothetical protein n=1 Tax=Streptomyces sp. NPDC059452 TaxID=3346835 RepID=UPI0036B19939